MGERLIVFCDLCNVDSSLSNPFYLGSQEQAIQAGWKEEDFGIICPKCSSNKEDDSLEFHGANFEGIVAPNEFFEKHEEKPTVKKRGRPKKSLTS